jgi:hypothetical protein
VSPEWAELPRQAAKKIDGWRADFEIENVYRIPEKPDNYARTIYSYDRFGTTVYVELKTKTEWVLKPNIPWMAAQTVAKYITSGVNPMYAPLAPFDSAVDNAFGLAEKIFEIDNDSYVQEITEFEKKYIN